MLKLTIDKGDQEDMGIMDKNLITISRLILVLTMLSGCIADPGVSKNRGRVLDFSQNGGNINGCGKAYLMWSALDTCSSNACPTKTHIATADEMIDINKYITDVINTAPTTATPAPNASTTTGPQAPNGQVPAGGVVDNTLLTQISNSAGVCLNDLPPKRPTGQVYINSDFCSCLKGVSDIVNDCSAACANYPSSDKPTLYLNTTVGPDIQLNSTLQNLAGWCNTPIPNVDLTNPQCALSAWDGVNTVTVPITTITGNSITTDITLLGLNKTYIVKIVENKSGSNAQSLEFQIRRVSPATPVTGQQGALKVAPISQYTCLSYIGQINDIGQILRESFTRKFYYFAANETPPPMPPLVTGVNATVICHDEVAYPGSDSIMYPRLELIPQAFSMWDKSDQRFATVAGKMAINTTIEQRLQNEHNTASTQDLFTVTSYPNRPALGSTAVGQIPMGVMMIPFLDPLSGKTMCPTRNDFLTATDPLFRVLKDYIDSTEAIYLGEKEPEVVMIDSTPTYEYGTMFVTEGIVKKYGFYIENGLKIKADQPALDSKTIYYYWPVNIYMDPLLQGDRKLFTIRYYDTINGQQPTSIPAGRTTDKRLGCVPTTPVL